MTGRAVVRRFAATVAPSGPDVDALLRRLVPAAPTASTSTSRGNRDYKP